MSGLLDKANEIRNLPEDGAAEDEFVLDESSGISKEDQEEILQEIEKVSEESRISVTPETMAVKAVKKGFLFPLLVNVFFVLLLIGGGLTLYFLFQRGQDVLMEEGIAITSAEGRLIEELKKESEAALQAKNHEINQIQAQLQDIDQQRRELQSNMDEKVAAREAELRESLQAELAAERQRLQEQGISEEDITTRLAALESEKTQAFQQDLEAFKSKAEEERRRQEDTLRTLQQEYQQSLAKAEAERTQVSQAAAAREAELRSQLEARERQLEQATLEAQEELNRLAAQQEKQIRAASQLNGFYSRVVQNIQAGDFDEALGDLDAIKQYLDDPSVATLPNMLQRREIELFVVDSIGSQVKEEMQRTEMDTTSLIESANLLNDMKNRILEGDALFRQNDIAGAEAKYREALNLIPEVNKVHSYFVAKADQAEQARRQTLAGFLQRAETAFAGGQYAGALDNYTKALAYLPQDAAAVEKMVGQIRRAGYELRAAELAGQNSPAAAKLLASAENLYNQKDYRGAVHGYVDLIVRYPESAQVAPAVEGVGKAVQALEQQARTSGSSGFDSQAAAALGGDAAGLESTLEQKNREIQDLEQRANGLSEDLKAKVALIETLQSEKRSLEQEITSLNSQIDQMQAEQAAALDNLDEQIKSKIARLENVEKRYNRLVDSYQEYARQEDALLNARGEDALVQSKLYLNAFLSASDESFPGLWERIKRYDEAFEKAGRASAAQDLSDILFELSVRDRSESRSLYLESEKTRYRDVPQMVDLIDDLRVLVKK